MCAGMFLVAISLYLLMVVAYATGRTWYVAHEGEWTRYCGRSRTTPCKVLQTAIDQSGFENDLILIEPSTKMYPLCWWKPRRLYKNVTLVGDGGLVKIGCEWRYKGGHILHFGRSKLKHSLYLHNLTVIDGIISAPEEFQAENVLFDNSVLTNNATDCQELEINILNSSWTGRSECHSQTGVCTGKTSDIACDLLSINIDNNNFESSAMILKSSGSIDVSVSDSMFRGPGNVTSLQLRISGTRKNTVSLRRTSFEHHHSQTLVEYAVNLYSSALLIRSGRSTSNVIVNMEDMTFRNNERGLALVGTFGEVNISRSTFSDNQAMHSGAAILCLTSERTPIHVTNCRFNNNVAGSFPHNFSFHLPHDVAKVVDGEAVLNSACCKGVIKPVGRGGAIRVQRGDMTITDSFFSENEANIQGGSIMVDMGSTLKLENTELNTSHGHAIMGAILFSRGAVEMNNVKMVATALRKRSSMLEHSGAHWSIKIQNIYAACPVGRNLRIDQIAAFGIGENGMRAATNLFDHVQYQCEACPRGLYSLDHGFLNDTRRSTQSAFYQIRVDGEDFDRVVTTGHHTHHFVKCLHCPQRPGHGGHSHSHNDNRDHQGEVDLGDGSREDDDHQSAEGISHYDSQDGYDNHTDSDMNDPYSGQCLDLSHPPVSGVTNQKISNTHIFSAVLLFVYLTSFV